MFSKPTEPRSIASQLVLRFTPAAAFLLFCALGVLYWIVVRHAFEEDNDVLTDKILALSADMTKSDGPQILDRELKNVRPGERVRNEVSFIMGFEVGAAPPAADPKDKKKADAKDKKSKSDPISPTAVIGDAEFELLPKGNNVWVKNAAQESQLIDEMRKGAKLTIKAASKKGNVTIDSYSLAGFSQAIDRALKDCPGT